VSLGLDVSRQAIERRVGRLRPARRDPTTSSSQASGHKVRRPLERRAIAQSYPHWFYLPAGIVFVVIFVIPTLAAFYFSLTRWTLFDAEFIGLENFRQFLREPALTGGLRNTAVYAVVTSGLKVVIGLLLATLLTSGLRSRNLLRSIIFFPVLVSTVAVGITFAVLMHPSDGLINKALELVGVDGPSWLTDPRIALLSVAFVDVWKGVGIALVIFIAAILSIPEEYTDAARLEGGAWVKFRHVIIPLSRNATFTVILLSFISGLRTFDLIWTMTRGGPGFTTDVITSTIYKQYQAGFYGLATAGNVILFIAVTLIVYPMMRYFGRREIEL
jgi:raffinose/stachyose/melibiose transport system permease protein